MKRILQNRIYQRGRQLRYFVQATGITTAEIPNQTDDDKIKRGILLHGQRFLRLHKKNLRVTEIRLAQLEHVSQAKSLLLQQTQSILLQQTQSNR